ncbi:MAG: B12-binding domain-containing radical SAM protein [Deltaproteobacteria bacterium]|nr:B12-binding domain-containing radical SAM protein [Deltaproteobacteria bacterium]
MGKSPAKVVLCVPYEYPPGLDLGLAYLGTSLRRAGIEVKILELVPWLLPFDKFAEWLNRERPPVLGFKVWTNAVRLARSYLKVIREVLPKSVVIIGGPHVTGARASALEHLEFADYAIAGEAERALPMLVSELLRGRPARKSVLAKIPGLVLQGRDGNFHVNTLDFPEDLDSIGPPAWDLLDFEQYLEMEQRAGKNGFSTAELNWLHIQAVRGCPNHCTYCMNLNQKPRWHSTEFVARQVELLKQKYGIRRFCFADDNLTADRNYAMALFDKIKSLDMKWDASVGLDLRTLDTELVKSMLESGCTRISLGVESGSDRLLKRMARPHRARDMSKTIKAIRRAGAGDITALMMLGFPGETDRDVLDTISLLRQMDVDDIWVNLFTPYPGIPITRKLALNHKLPNLDYRNLSHESVSMGTGHIPGWRLELYYIAYYAAFYSRPSRLFKLIQKQGVFEITMKSAVLAAHALVFGKGPTRDLFRSKRIAALRKGYNNNNKRRRNAVDFDD